MLSHCLFDGHGTENWVLAVATMPTCPRDSMHSFGGFQACIPLGVFMHVGVFMHAAKDTDRTHRVANSGITPCHFMTNTVSSKA